MTNLISTSQDAEIKTTVRLRKNISDALTELVSDRKRVLSEIERNESIMVDRLSTVLSIDNINPNETSDNALKACELLRKINNDKIEREKRWRAGDIDTVFEIFDVFTSRVFEED